MSKRNWIIAVTLGIAILTTEAWSQSAPEDEPRQEESAADTNQNGESQNGQPVDLAPALKGIETAIRDLIAEEDQIAADAQQSRESRDLEAQEGMAKWAEWMFYATGATVLLTLAALFAIVRTLHHTRRAADTAADMARDTREIGQAQVRAYLYVKSARFTRKREGISIFLEVENLGQSPARAVKVEGELTLQLVGGMPQMPRVIMNNTSLPIDAEFEPLITGAAKEDVLYFWTEDHLGYEDGAESIAVDANEMEADVVLSWVDVFNVEHKASIWLSGHLAPSPWNKIKTVRNKGAMEIRISSD